MSARGDMMLSHHVPPRGTSDGRGSVVLQLVALYGVIGIDTISNLLSWVVFQHPEGAWALWGTLPGNLALSSTNWKYTLWGGKG